MFWPVTVGATVGRWVWDLGIHAAQWTFASAQLGSCCGSLECQDISWKFMEHEQIISQNAWKRHGTMENIMIIMIYDVSFTKHGNFVPRVRRKQSALTMSYYILTSASLLLLILSDAWNGTHWGGCKLESFEMGICNGSRLNQHGSELVDLLSITSFHWLKNSILAT